MLMFASLFNFDSSTLPYGANEDGCQAPVRGTDRVELCRSGATSKGGGDAQPVNARRSPRAPQPVTGESIWPAASFEWISLTVVSNPSQVGGSHVNNDS